MDDCPLGPREDSPLSRREDGRMPSSFSFITRQVSFHSTHHYTPPRTSIGSQSRNKMVFLQ